MRNVLGTEEGFSPIQSLSSEPEGSLVTLCLTCQVSSHMPHPMLDVRCPVDAEVASPHGYRRTRLLPPPPAATT